MFIVLLLLPGLAAFFCLALASSGSAVGGMLAVIEAALSGSGAVHSEGQPGARLLVSDGSDSSMVIVIVIVMPSTRRGSRGHAC